MTEEGLKQWLHTLSTDKAVRLLLVDLTRLQIINSIVLLYVCTTLCTKLFQGSGDTTAQTPSQQEFLIGVNVGSLY